MEKKPHWEFESIKPTFCAAESGGEGAASRAAGDRGQAEGPHRGRHPGLTWGSSGHPPQAPHTLTLSTPAFNRPPSVWACFKVWRVEALSQTGSQGSDEFWCAVENTHNAYLKSYFIILRPRMSLSDQVVSHHQPDTTQTPLKGFSGDETAMINSTEALQCKEWSASLLPCSLSPKGVSKRISRHLLR